MFYIDSGLPPAHKSHNGTARGSHFTLLIHCSLSPIRASTEPD